MKEVCPHCKKKIDPIIADSMLIVVFPEKRNKRTVRLLGCLECKIIFCKE